MIYKCPLCGVFVSAGHVCPSYVLEREVAYREQYWEDHKHTMACGDDDAFGESLDYLKEQLEKAYRREGACIS